MRHAGLDQTQAGIKITGRSINNLRYADDTTLYGKKWRTKEPLDKSESGEWKSWLKTQCSENYHLVWPITSWQINGETVETVSDFILLGSKITADGDCSHEIKRHLLIGRKAMTNLDSILKSRDITLPTKAHPTVMCGYESWTIKKTEDWRIDAFELWFERLCWRRLLRVPWTARRPNQFILNEIFPEYSLEGLMLKLKLQYFGHLIWRAKSMEKTRCWKRLKAGGERSGRGLDGWMASLTEWTWVWASSGKWRRTGKPGMLQFTCSQRVRHN